MLALETVEKQNYHIIDVLALEADCTIISALHEHTYIIHESILDLKVISFNNGTQHFFSIQMYLVIIMLGSLFMN